MIKWNPIERELIIPLFLFIILSSFIFAQDSYPLNYKSVNDSFNDNRQLTFLRIPDNADDYRLGPGDLIEIQIVGLDGFTQSERITNSGDINSPLFGLIHADRMTCEELENLLVERLVANDFIREPQVLIYVTEYRAKPIYVLGQVDRPGQYLMTQQLTLMDAILIAGGLDFGAAQYGILHRKREGIEFSLPVKINPDGSLPDNSLTEVTKLDLQPMKEGRMLEPNPVLQRGDIIFIPERKVEFFYAVGDIFQPGAYEIPQGQKVLVSHALSWAGGPTKTAKMSSGVLIRYDKRGTRQELSVDFDAIVKGKKPDFEVSPDDVIFVPGSNAKTVGYGLLTAVPRIAQSYLIYGLIF
jgi:polysaccharide export outer membrane protein